MQLKFPVHASFPLSEATRVQKERQQADLGLNIDRNIFDPMAVVSLHNKLGFHLENG
jgi:hypothetical protein